MAFQDRELRCADCGANFTFSAGEQAFYQSKGYTNEPKRCPACRETRKAERFGSDPSAAKPRRQMFPVTCAGCGKPTEVPFEPRQGRPVYCSECFAKMKATK
ncbi:MAG: zinc-ribbon domain containing protein [Chloroflexota bacterium]